MKRLFWALPVFAALPCLAQPVSSASNLVIVTIDGLRWQEVFEGADSVLIRDPQVVNDPGLLQTIYWDGNPEKRRQRLMPFFWSVVSGQGQIYGNRNFENKIDVTNFFKISYPGYNEMLSGYPDPIFIPNVPLRNRNHTLLEYLNNQAAYEGRVAAFSSWNLFPAILNRKRSGLPVNSGFESFRMDSSLEGQLVNRTQDSLGSHGHTRPDELTFLLAKTYLKNHHPKVMLLSFGQTDEFAHAGKYDRYLQQIAALDQMMGELWYQLQTDPFYRNRTTLVITTDHGRGSSSQKWTTHGIFTPGSSQVWLALMGPDLAPLGEIRSPGQLFQRQLAATFLSLIGSPMPEMDLRSAAIPVSRTESPALASNP